MSNKRLLFVISAPAGAGKTTLVKRLLGEFPDTFAQSRSSTTRKPRPNEVNGQDYDFISVEEFERLVDEDAFLEHAKVFGNNYGTRIEEVERLKKEGKHVILVIDTKGAMKIKEKTEAIYIFISPPSLDSLKERLFKRGTEDIKTNERRFEHATKELSMIPHYDYNIVNDNLEESYKKLRSIMTAESRSK